MSHYGHLVTYYLVAFLFPIVSYALAEREIIANALLVRISPRTEGKDTNNFRNKKENERKVWKYKFLFLNLHKETKKNEQ